MFGSENQSCCVSLNMCVCVDSTWGSVSTAGTKFRSLYSWMLFPQQLTVNRNQFHPHPTSFSRIGQILHTSSHTNTHKYTLTHRPFSLLGDVLWQVRDPPLSCFYTTLLNIITSSFLSRHPPFIAFVFVLFCSCLLFTKWNISNIGKLYYKEGVAWMYVYMRNYVKTKKMIYPKKQTKKLQR